METWKKIDGFESYEVSDWGRVRRGERVLKGSIRKDGYIQLRVGGRDGFCFLIHRLVGLTFLPNPEAKPTINHIDHDKTNNRLENLEWATLSEQKAHSPNPIGKSGYRNIYQMKCGSWKLQIRRDLATFTQTFPTLPEAIKARDEFL